MAVSKKNTKYERKPLIQDFYANKSVFITGVTGFMGKVLLEKLLRSCPKINKIYVLLREKKGKKMEERLADLLALPVFTKIRRSDETLLQKIIPLRGNVSELQLGLSEEDRETLIQNVNIVFHAAASVRFDDPFKDAILMNTRGTHEILKISAQMKDLVCFVYVSTTYCNLHKDVIDEKVYPAVGDWKKLIKIAENIDSHTLQVFSRKILGLHPNTYTFSKSLAEQICKEFQDVVPIAIFRPSVVISSILEPLPGWVDNFNGPVGLLVAGGKGILKVVYTNPNTCPDYIPVDLAIRALIVVSWHRATGRNVENLEVFNCSSYGIKSVNQKRLNDIALYVTTKVPLNDIIWIPKSEVTSCKFIYYWKVFSLHIIPALIIDTVLKLNKKKPILMKLQRKIFCANAALECFLLKDWVFKNEKLLSLNNELLSNKDFDDFNYRIDSFDEMEYFKTASYGAREYLLKEDNTSLPEAQKHFKRMYWVDKAANFLLLIIIVTAVVKLGLIQSTRSFILTAFAIFRFVL